MERNKVEIAIKNYMNKIFKIWLIFMAVTIFGGFILEFYFSKSITICFQIALVKFLVLLFASSIHILVISCHKSEFLELLKYQEEKYNISFDINIFDNCVVFDDVADDKIYMNDEWIVLKKGLVFYKEEIKDFRRKKSYTGGKFGYVMYDYYFILENDKEYVSYSNYKLYKIIKEWLKK